MTRLKKLHYDVLKILAQRSSLFFRNSLDVTGTDQGSSWPGGSCVGGGCNGKRFFLTGLKSMYFGDELTLYKQH